MGLDRNGYASGSEPKPKRTGGPLRKNRGAVGFAEAVESRTGQKWT